VSITLFFALAACGPALQDPADLVEQLRSDEILVRDRAFQKLEGLGDRAEAHLKKAAEDPDPELSRRARLLLRIHEIDRRFSPALRKAIPGIARRLARDGDHEWTKIYLEMAAEPGKAGSFPFPELRREDLEPLAAEALRRAETPEEMEAICAAIKAWRHQSAEPELLKSLRHVHSGVRRSAFSALERFHGPFAAATLGIRETADDAEALATVMWNASPHVPTESVIRLIPLLRHPERSVRSAIGDALDCLDAVEAVPAVLNLLRDGNPEFRKEGLDLLARLDPREQRRAILALLDDPDSDVRRAVVRIAANRGLIPAADRLEALFRDPDESVRVSAIENLGKRLDVDAGPALIRTLRDHGGAARNAALVTLAQRKGGAPAELVIPFLGHPEAEVRQLALRYLASCGAVGAAAEIAPLLDDRDSDVCAAAVDAVKALRIDASPDRLLRIVRDHDGRAAAEAAILLARTSPELVQPHLERLFFEEGHFKAHEIVHLLALTKHPDPVGFLKQGLEREEPIWEETVKAIIALNTPASLQALRSMLKDPEDGLRRLAATWFCRRNAPEARADLLPLLEDSYPAIQVLVLDYLGRTGLGTETDRIRKLTQDDNSLVRRGAAAALQKRRVAEAGPDFIRLLEDTEEGVALEAARGLAALGDRRVVPVALAWLQSGDAHRRECGFQMLSILHPREELPRVVRLLEHRESKVRVWAARVIGRIGARERARSLIPLLRDPATQYPAAALLRDLEARELLPDLIAMLEDPDVHARDGAMQAIMVFRALEAAPRIRRFLKDPDLFIRQKAVDALAIIRDREAIPDLILLLKDPAGVLRAEAADAMGELAYREMIPALVGLLNDPDGRVRWCACNTLAELHAVEAVPDLIRMLRDPSCRERGRVVMTLARLKAMEAIPVLIPLLENGDLRLQVADALADLGSHEAMKVLNGPGGDPVSAALKFARQGDLSGLDSVLRGDCLPSRWEAAEFLCERGDRRAVPEVLRLSEELEWGPHGLNALRRPEVWKKLRERRMPADEEGAAPNLLARLGRRAGLEVRWESGTSFDELAFRTDWVDLGWYSADLDLIEVLDRAFDETPGGRPAWRTNCPVDFILEDDHIRILPRGEAIKFWKAWWEAEQKK
jgi:HEAT repeat protein